MKKFLPFSHRQPSLDRYTINRSSGRFGKSLRRTSASSLSSRSIQVVRGAYNIDLNKVDSSFTKLHRACLLNDEAQVRKHIQKVDNNSADSSKRYPIHLATVNGNYAIVKLLIENNANPDVQDSEDNTPLIKAIQCGHEHLVKYLLDNGADPNKGDQDKNTALHWAISTESIIAIDALIHSKKCDLLLRNNKDETYLHLAVRSPLISEAIFDALISSGMDLDAKDQLGLTTLDIAQACNNRSALKALQKHKRVSFQDDVDSAEAISRTANLRKMCDEYKQKYAQKNKENLEYEKRVIHLNAQIERLKIDMDCMREHSDKLDKEIESLKEENARLKLENAQVRETACNGDAANTSAMHHQYATIDSPRVIERIASNERVTANTRSIEFRGHDEFLATKTLMQERINKLKYELAP